MFVEHIDATGLSVQFEENCAAAVVVGCAVIVRTSRVVRPGITSRSSRPGQLAAGIGMGLREAARNRVLWPLLVAVPVVFVLLAPS